MGLDVTFDAFQGSYSLFNRWRNEVARAAGYEISMYSDGTEQATIVLAPRWTEENYDGVWEVDPGDILLVLLVHSDCDGIITPKHARKLAARLFGLVPWIDNPTYKNITIQFAEACGTAALRRRPLRFA